MASGPQRKLDEALDRRQDEADQPVRSFDVIDPERDFDASKVKLVRTAGFNEENFVNNFMALINANKPEAAAKFLVDELPALGKSNLNRKEKLNHLLYLGRFIQNAGRTKHGYRKLLNKAAGVENQIAGIPLPPGGGFLELGCGAHDPVALATYYYLNGFDRAHAIDLLPPRNPTYSAFSMYDTLVNVRAFPRRYCREGVEPGTVMQRASKFNIGMFERGNFAAGLKSVAAHVKYENVDVAQSSIEDGSLSLLVSFAVLEHVDDLTGVCRKLFKALKPGGVAFHFIDMADHRSYAGDGKYGALSFLTEETAPANMNRLRAQEHLDAQIEAGFEVLKEQRECAAVTPELRARLLPRFAAMPEKDYSAIKMYLVVRKPG